MSSLPADVTTDGRLVRIESKVDTIVSAVTDVRDDIKDHESRLRKLENMVYKASGVSAVIGAGGAAIVQQLMK
jgi:hypothetical protein